MKRLIFIVLIIFLAITECISQQTRIVFYNVENLFDTEDDPLTRDDEYLPEGDRHWNQERYWRKVVRIYQVIAALGEGEMPAIIGLCEIENRKVLERLVFGTPLRKFNYRIIHQDSPDARGIDVALIYRPDLFQPYTSTWIPVTLPGGEQTREILHAAGKLFDDRMVHIYVNHWPSRWGGAVSSKARRMAAARVLRTSVEEVLMDGNDANIVIMGDFNDEPGDESIKWLCSVRDPAKSGQPALINYSERKLSVNSPGTIKHQGNWGVFDQMILSRGLVQGSNGLKAVGEAAEIFSAEFLSEPDETYTGFKPFRTYIGPGYHGGYSDHYPVSIMVGTAE